jgi:hypothetical protein
VIVRPYRPGPRYVFKDHDGRRDYVTRERQRPSNEGRRVTERDRTSADVGGRGAVPAPVEPRGRRTVDDRTGQDGRPGREAETPRRRTDDGGNQPPNVLPRDNPAPKREDNPRRRDSESNSNLRPVEPDRPGVQQPDRRSEPRRNDQRTEPRAEPRREEPRREEPSRAAEPRREETRRPEPSRTEPSRSSPPRSEPRREPAPRTEPRRSDPPSESRPQPTGDPQLRRRRPS